MQRMNITKLKIMGRDLLTLTGRIIPEIEAELTAKQAYERMVKNLHLCYPV